MTQKTVGLVIVSFFFETLIYPECMLNGFLLQNLKFSGFSVSLQIILVGISVGRARLKTYRGRFEKPVENEILRNFAENKCSIVVLLHYLNVKLDNSYIQDSFLTFR